MGQVGAMVTPLSQPRGQAAKPQPSPIFTPLIVSEYGRDRRVRLQQRSGGGGSDHVDGPMLLRQRCDQRRCEDDIAQKGGLDDEGRCRGLRET